MAIGVPALGNSEARILEGGYATRVINNTGGPSIKGYLVKNSTAIDNAVEYTQNDDVGPSGVIYSDNVPNGQYMWIITSGRAQVYYGTTVARGTFCRVPVVADGIVTPGQAVAEALPVPPLAIDKHFQECGHPSESRGTPGLAWTTVHFN